MTLRDYQHAGVEHLHRVPRCMLALDMGLGKTAITLSALTREHLPALVVAPPRVAENVWHAERDLWRPDLTVARAVGTPKQRQAAYDEHADITAISVFSLADVIPIRNRYRTVIFDESSLFKVQSSIRFKMAAKLTKDTPNVWLLTGTPAPNGYLDLWPQLFLIDRGARLYKFVTHYRKRYFDAKRPLPNGIIPGWDPKPGALTAIDALIEDVCMSMTSEGRLDLPPMTINPVAVTIPPAARRAYNELRKNLVTDLEVLGLGRGQFYAPNASALSNRLRQLSSGFQLDPDDREKVTHVHRAKLDALREVVDGTGSPVLVFYAYRAERAMIQREFGGAVHTTDEKDWYPRWNRRELPILLVHPAQIGHGLNLQPGGNVCAWFGPTWNLEHWDQGNKRLHRPGQADHVMVHVLVASPVDRAMLDRVEGKADVQAALMKALESPM